MIATGGDLIAIQVYRGTAKVGAVWQTGAGSWLAAHPGAAEGQWPTVHVPGPRAGLALVLGATETEGVDRGGDDDRVDTASRNQG